MIPEKISKQINLILTLASNDLKLRYKNSILGFFWSLINPLLYLLIFIAVFGNAFPDIENYPLYVITGIIFWIFFTTATSKILDSIIKSTLIIKSIYINALVYPISTLISNIYNLLLSLFVFFLIMIYFNMDINLNILWIFPLIALFSIFILGISIFLCAINVYFRDVSLLWSSILPALFYASPIAYSANLIPGNFMFIMKLNPLFYFMNIFRDVLYYGTYPNLRDSLIALLLTTVSLIIGLLVFKRLEKGFISNL